MCVCELYHYILSIRKNYILFFLKKMFFVQATPRSVVWLEHALQSIQ